jgi:hypothetical protein
LLGKRDETGEVRLSGEKQTDEYSFDELARGLATGTISRGRALKMMGAAILGGGVLTLLPGVAQGQDVGVEGGGCADNEKAINNKRCPTNSCGRGEAGCRCATSVNGNKRCVKFNRDDCTGRRRCNSNSDCDNNEACVKVGGCCGDRQLSICRPTCDPG